MKEKIIKGALSILIFICLIFISTIVKFSIALLLTIILTVTISISLIILQYQITFAKKLLLAAFFLLCCEFGYFWGAQSFFISLLISGIGCLLMWNLVKDPYKQSVSYETKKPIEHLRKIIKRPEPYFAGKGTKIEISGYILEDPLIYVVDSKTYEDYDASLLCLRRLIAPPQNFGQPTLPYWPRLSDASPVQVGNYVNWLATGRKDPSIELGYVFIYFYGLERRVLLDQKDILDAGNEILRLLKIYGYSNSFRQYATGLIIHLILLNILRPTEKIIDVLIKFQQGHLSDALQVMLLGYLAKNNLPMPPKWAIHFAKQDQRTIRSVVLNKSFDEFSKLFTLRYKEDLFNKMIPKLGKNHQEIAYHAASPTLLRSSGFGSILPSAKWVTVIGWSKQFSPVIKLFNDCIEDLKAYSRKAARHPEDRSLVFESLPSELQEELQHPQQKEWDALLENYADENVTCLIPVGKIASLKQIEYRQMLSLGQSKLVAQFVESFGSSIEPDPRYTQKPLQWDDHISVLRLPDKPFLPQGQNYSLVSLIMPLAIEVSLASGDLEENERRIINEFFQERFMLTRNDRLRLEALIDVTLKNGVSLSGTKKKLVELFEENQRRAIGKFLVMIAGAVDGVCFREFKALEKTFISLGLDKELVKDVIIELGYETPESRRLVVKGTKELRGETIPPKVAVLDVDKIRRIHEDSIEASKLLIQAMNQSVSEEGKDGVDTISGKVIGIHNGKDYIFSIIAIPDHIKPFLKDIVTKEEWLNEEIESLAQKHNITVSAALEEINTWADENLGDFLIEEGTPVIVNMKLLGRIGGNS